jgi:hypothetical protein
MSARVRLKQDAGGQRWMSYTRYHHLHWIKTGTTDQAEAERMAEDLDASLLAEQRKKMKTNPDWRPEGLPMPEVLAPAAKPAEGFNLPRVRKGGR